MNTNSGLVYTIGSLQPIFYMHHFGNTAYVSFDYPAVPAPTNTLWCEMHVGAIKNDHQPHTFLDRSMF